MQVTQTTRVFLSEREIREALKRAFPHHMTIQSMSEDGRNTTLEWRAGLGVSVARDVTAAQSRVAFITAGTENSQEAL